MARVAHLFRAPKHGLPMEEQPAAEAIEDFGFLACCHAHKGGKRQILLVDKETLDMMDLPPGIIRENITTVGLDVNGLKPGEQLRIGTALVEVAMVCTPCNQMEKVRPGLRRELYGRRGMLCRVLAGGTIRAGDPIERLPPNPTA
jgi:MOSC domain-containing protein YiiM